MIILLLIFLVIFIFLSASFLLSVLVLLVPPISTPKRVIKRALKEAELKPGDFFYDLGCGQGKVVVEAYKNYGCQAIGYELNPPIFLWAKFKIILSGGFRNIKIHFKNFLNQDLSKADVIFCYLIPRLMKKLERKLEKEPLKKGARIVSFTFTFKNSQPQKIIKINPKTPRIYIYKV